MDEARALRDTLEKAQAELRRTRTHFDKLRAHQARERESLQREVDAARREVAELRARLEAPPVSARAEVGGAQPPAARGVVASNALVALVRKPESFEASVPALSRLLGVSGADLRLRLAALEPAVLARVPASEAEALRAALQAEGFLAVSCDIRPRVAAGLLRVRRFTFDAEGLQLEGAQGERQRLPYAELRLLVRGRRTTTTVEEVEDWDAPRVRDGRGRVSTEPTRKEVRTEHSSQLLWLYGDGGRAAFSEGTQFMGLGARRGLSLHESLQNLAAELRERAPQVVMDERLMALPRFNLPLVDPERSVELFAELLFEAVRRGLWT